MFFPILGGTHSTVKSAVAGLDQEQPYDNYFGAALEEAVRNGKVSVARLNDMVHRILRGMFDNGVIDNPPVKQVTDPFRGRDDAEHIAEESIVLLKNTGNILPLSASLIHSIAIIGSHADVGVLSGGGSAQVDSPGGNSADPHPGGARWGETVYFPSSPLKEIHTHAPNARVLFNEGTDATVAATLAANCDVALVFLNQPMSEGTDASTIALPGNQNSLVEKIAAANPHTIVILETGGPVSMPFADDVQGIIEAWYPGIGGAQALANILFGNVDPSGRLAVTFAKGDDQLAHPEIAGMIRAARLNNGSISGHDHRQEEPPPVNANLAEGVRVGYKWFESERKTPLFPFGFGLSYTTYEFSALTVDSPNRLLRFTIRNTGKRPGTEVAQVYAVLPSSTGESNFRRLVAWERVQLAQGQSKTVTLKLDPAYLSIFNEQKNQFELAPGQYQVFVGSSSEDVALSTIMRVTEQ